MLFSGENGTEIVARLKRDLLPTMLNGAMYWPICDFITFKFCPVHLQVCMLHYYHFKTNHLFSSWLLSYVEFRLGYITQCWFLFLCAATCEQLVFVSMDNLHNLHGKPRETNCHCRLKHLSCKPFLHAPFHLHGDFNYVIQK